MDPDTFVKARIHYFAREKYYHSMQLAAVDGIKRFNGDPTFKFYYGMALILEGRIQEGIRELDPLQGFTEVMLGALLALIHAHKLCLTIDKEAIAEYDSKLKEERKRADDQALYFAGLFLLYVGKPEKAKDYSDRLLKINPQSKDGLVLKGWIELQTTETTKSALQYFEAALKLNHRHVDATFGKAKYFEKSGNFEEANRVLSTMVVLYPDFLPPLTEKMKVELCLRDWEQSVDETATRILATDSRNVEAHKYKILRLLCREGDYERAERQLRNLYSELEKVESQNGWQFMRNAQLFSRICGRNKKILQVTTTFAEKAASLDTNSDVYMCEVGYQHLLREKIKDAQRYYKTALKLDESSIQALIGIIACQLHDGQYEVARNQLEFLKEIQVMNGDKSVILYMNAVLCRLSNKGDDNVLELLNEAVDIHFRSVKGLAFGVEYLTYMNPDFVTNLVREYMLYSPNQPPIKGQVAHPALKKTLMILEPVTKACPGLKEAHFLVGKAKFLNGDLKGAVSTLQHLLDKLDPTDSEAYLLMAQIQLYQANYIGAQQNLEIGLSYNFEVRDHPMFHLINAKVQKEQGHVEEAIETLKKALELLNKRKTVIYNASNKISFTQNDRVSLYLELTEAYRLNGQNQEATKTMQEALNEYKGTPEEIRITVANADLALEKGEVETALEILRSIGSDQPYFVQAQEKMAQIYLRHRKDKRMYAQCYRVIAERAPPTPQSYALLGDAYMNIQEPDRALEVYEQALKRNPRDPTLSAKMGKALQKTHQYGKALNYYKEALKNDIENSRLKYDMAELQMKLKHYDKAEKTISQALKDGGNSNDVNNDDVNDGGGGGDDDVGSFISRAELYSLLAEIHERRGNIESAISNLNYAKDLRDKVIKRIRIESTPDIGITEQRQRRIAARICRKMAEYSASGMRDFDSAIQRYKEALQFDPNDPSALCALARLYLTMDDLNQCQYTCMTLLKTDKDNEEAAVMMADLAFRKNDYETAMFHFQQLLNKRPDYWVALARLIEVMRRTGHLEDVPEYLNKSEEYVGTRSSLEPGLHFCRGLYEWYSGDANGALKLFNKARRDNEWGQRSIYNMIEICLNPDNATIGGEVFETVDSRVHADATTDSREMAIKTAEKLLRELNPRQGQQMVSYKLLQGMILLASKAKASVEKALQDFMALASTEGRENAGAILGMATAYQLLKQTPKARNQLKRVAKHSWNFEDAEYLERCWLLLADIYIQGGKYDMATELLRKVLSHNKSATKAYEYTGYIMEKESSYKDAAQNYEQAWKYGNKADPGIGYKLAFNYMKAKRYTDAIDVSHEILAKHPNYPKIRKEILEKSRDGLKR